MFMLRALFDVVFALRWFCISMHYGEMCCLLNFVDMSVVSRSVSVSALENFGKTARVLMSWRKFGTSVTVVTEVLIKQSC
jgi:hypothetical protein